jgi:Asp/Glu/hydantoin racemase
MRNRAKWAVRKGGCPSPVETVAGAELPPVIGYADPKTIGPSRQTLMPPRIFALHAYRFSMAPIEEAFRRLWPEAEAVRLLDESLYADAGADGRLPDNIRGRLSGLFRHCELSGARGIVFTGSTFGPAVDAAKAGMAVPVLKADEAMAEAAVERSGSIQVLATAKRALPVIRANVEAAATAAGRRPEIAEDWVAGAKEANDAGRPHEHDRLIADAIARAANRYEIVLLGQMSMAPARALLPAELTGRVVTSPDASVEKMRRLVDATTHRLQA